MSEAELSPAGVMHDLHTSFIGQKIFCYDVLDSTMEAARREALWGATAGTVIIADRQTQGRGRLQRPWLSPTGSLAFSIILRPNIEYLPYMVMLTSMAVCNSIKSVTRLRPVIKWPNDILINEKKVSGILIENDIRNNSLKYCIIGIGINVNLHIPDMPEIASIATSLSDQMGKQISRQNILVHCLTEMDTLYKLLPKTDYIVERWQKNLITLGQKVQVTWKDQIFTGTAESTTSDGNLLVRETSGALREVMAGDVTLA